MRRFLTSLTRLRVRLAVIIAVALAPAGVLAIVQAINAVDALAEQQTDLVEVQAQSAVDVERANLMEIRQALRLAASDTTQILEDGEDCRQPFAQLQAEHNWLLNVVIFDSQGQSRCSTGNPVSVGSLDEWTAFVANPAFTLSAVRIGRLTGKRVLIGYYPLRGTTEDAIAIGMSIDVDSFEAISSIASEGVEAALLDRSGAIITSNDDIAADWLPEDRSALLIFGDRRVNALDANDAPRNYVVSSLVPEQLWSVVNAPAPSLAANLFSVAGLSILAPIAIWLIAVSVAYFAIDLLVTRHVGELRRVAVRIGGGDLQAEVTGLDDAPTEIRALGASITAMRDKIADRESELKRTLEVQHRLLLEIHHRVKNNLQTISSLMNLERSRIRSPEAQAQIDSIQGRIHSLAMVHQNLYAAENLEEVALDQLTRNIASHLQDSLAPDGEESITRMELEPLVAPTVMATPIALFLSEALGNAFKHAARPPDVHISLSRQGTWITLSVDNIVEQAIAAKPDTSSGLGMELMRGFAKQIGGSFDTGMADGRFHVSLQVPTDRHLDLFSVRKT